MPRALASLLVVSVLSGCSSAGGARDAATPLPSPEAVASPTASAPAEVGAEGGVRPAWLHEGQLSERPAALARELVSLTRGLKRYVARWVDADDPADDAAEDTSRRPLVIGALRQQRIYRHLSAHPRRARRAIASLPAGLARFARDHVAIAARLARLVTPVEPPARWPVHQPSPVHALRRYYDKAEARFDVPWEVLAAVNFVESRFGRIMGPSSAGALGPMQFMPATWDAYGNGGDIWDPRDSIMAAGRYLSASGAPEDMRSALYAYNRSYDYVAAIRTYARHIQRDPRNFYLYYFWQVFVATTEGDLQLTGPGGRRRP